MDLLDLAIPDSTGGPSFNRITVGATNVLTSLSQPGHADTNPTGGPSMLSTFSHLQHLPMFSLERTAEEWAVIQRKEARRNQAQSNIRVQSGKDKAVMTVVGLAAGAHIGGVVATENNLNKLNIAGANFALSEAHVVVVTRWAAHLPAAAPPRVLLVDIFETRPHKSWMGQVVAVRANQPVTVRVRGEWTARIKSGADAWVKRTMSAAAVDDIAVVDGVGASKGGLFSRRKKAAKESAQVDVPVPMELVMRHQRATLAVEYHTMEKRFERSWIVPIL